MEYPTIISITSDDLNISELLSKVTLTTTGAVVFFTGVVRASTRKGEIKDTSYLEYEAYLPMAEKQMLQVAEEIRCKWPEVQGIAIVQRIGRIDSKTPTTIVACSSAHRDDGIFEAAHFGIDRLKEIVPVWKKEVGPNGEQWVEGHYHPSAGE